MKLASKIYACLAVFWVGFGSMAMADPVSAWTFLRNDGSTASMRLEGIATVCPSHDAKITVSAGAQTIVANACLDDETRPSRLLAFYNLPSGGGIGAFYLYQGVEYFHTISVLETSGTPTGDPIGNSLHGWCSVSMNAFVSLPGSAIADVPEYGYCLLPSFVQPSPTPTHP